MSRSAVVSRHLSRPRAASVDLRASAASLSLPSSLLVVWLAICAGCSAGTSTTDHGSDPSEQPDEPDQADRSAGGDLTAVVVVDREENDRCLRPGFPDGAMSIQPDSRYWKIPTSPSADGRFEVARLETMCRVDDVEQLNDVSWMATLDCADGDGRHPFEARVTKTPRPAPRSVSVGMEVRLRYTSATDAEGAVQQWFALHDASGEHLLIAWIRAGSTWPPDDDGSFFSPWVFSEVRGVCASRTKPCCPEPCPGRCPPCPPEDAGQTYEQAPIGVQLTERDATRRRLVPRELVRTPAGALAYLKVGLRVFDSTCGTIADHSELDFAFVGPAPTPK